MTTFTYLTKEEIYDLSGHRAAKYRRRLRIYKIQKQLCDICKCHIDIFTCREVREKPSKHLNLVCISCKINLQRLQRSLDRLQNLYGATLAYLKRKKMYHKALLRFNRMRDNIAQVY